MQLHRPLIAAALTALALFSAAALGAGTAGLLYLQEISAIEPTSFDTSAALRAAHALPDSGPLPIPEATAALSAFTGADRAAEVEAELLEVGDTAGASVDVDVDDGSGEVDGEPVWKARLDLDRPRRRAGARAGTESGGAPAAQAQSQGSTCSDKIDGVTRHSSTKYTLSRSFVSTYIKDQDTAAQQGRAAWRQNKQRDNVGIRVAGLRCAPRAAGLRNNDVIKEINGRPMTSNVNAYAAYKDVKSGDRFSIKLKRDGQLMTIQYTVR